MGQKEKTSNSWTNFILYFLTVGIAFIPIIICGMQGWPRITTGVAVALPVLGIVFFNYMSSCFARYNFYKNLLTLLTKGFCTCSISNEDLYQFKLTFNAKMDLETYINAIKDVAPLVTIPNRTINASITTPRFRAKVLGLLKEQLQDSAKIKESGNSLIVTFSRDPAKELYQKSMRNSPTSLLGIILFPTKLLAALQELVEPKQAKVEEVAALETNHAEVTAMSDATIVAARVPSDTAAVPVLKEKGKLTTTAAAETNAAGGVGAGDAKIETTPETVRKSKPRPELKRYSVRERHRRKAPQVAPIPQPAPMTHEEELEVSVAPIAEPFVDSVAVQAPVANAEAPPIAFVTEPLPVVPATKLAPAAEPLPVVPATRLAPAAEPLPGVSDAEPSPVAASAPAVAITELDPAQPAEAVAPITDSAVTAEVTTAAAPTAFPIAPILTNVSIFVPTLSFAERLAIEKNACLRFMREYDLTLRGSEVPVLCFGKQWDNNDMDFLLMTDLWTLFQRLQTEHPEVHAKWIPANPPMIRCAIAGKVAEIIQTNESFVDIAKNGDLAVASLICRWNKEWQRLELIDPMNGAQYLSTNILHYNKPVTETVVENPIRLLRLIRYLEKDQWFFDYDLLSFMYNDAYFAQYLPRELVQPFKPTALFFAFDHLFLSGKATKHYQILQNYPIGNRLMTLVLTSRGCTNRQQYNITAAFFSLFLQYCAGLLIRNKVEQVMQILDTEVKKYMQDPNFNPVDFITSQKKLELFEYFLNSVVKILNDAGYRLNREDLRTIIDPPQHDYFPTLSGCALKE
jgi:hypothetical protein